MQFPSFTTSSEEILVRIRLAPGVYRILLLSWIVSIIVLTFTFFCPGVQ